MIVKRVKRPITSNSPDLVVLAHVAHNGEKLLVLPSLLSGCPEFQNLSSFCIHSPGNAHKSLSFALVLVAHPLPSVVGLQSSAIKDCVDWLSSLHFLALHVIPPPKPPQAAADAAVMRRAWQ